MPMTFSSILAGFNDIIKRMKEEIDTYLRTRTKLYDLAPLLYGDGESTSDGIDEWVDDKDDVDMGHGQRPPPVYFPCPIDNRCVCIDECVDCIMSAKCDVYATVLDD